jgi:membrane-bound lytic murein transglycosylase A
VLRPEITGPLVPVGGRTLPSFTDDLDLASLRLAVTRSLPAYARASDTATAAAATRLLEILEATPDPAARRKALAKAFRIVRVRRPLLLTAYYEPELAASLTPDTTFTHPLYTRPADLIDVEPSALDVKCPCRRLAGRVAETALVPYYTRAEIDAGALAGRRIELAWAADPLALFALHVQGSGRLRLADGRTVGVRYAGTNGRRYRSLGRTLVERGLLPPNQAGMDDIRRVLESVPPAERDALLATNERYTFFRTGNGEPIGNLGVELTPGRSIASDPRLVPRGALAYLATSSYQRFVVSQDTGAAVTGPHADLFLGAGADAERQAGRTRERGTLYLLLPR